ILDTAEAIRHYRLRDALALPIKGDRNSERLLLALFGQPRDDLPLRDVAVEIRLLTKGELERGRDERRHELVIEEAFGAVMRGGVTTARVVALLFFEHGHRSRIELIDHELRFCVPHVLLLGRTL